MSELAYKSAHELQKMLVKKSISCLEITDYFLKRIEKINPKINSILYIDEDERKFAKKIDVLIAKGETDLPLLGVPSIISDVFHMKNTPTTHGSLIFKDEIIDHDAIEIGSLKKAGSPIIAKANIAEFGLSYETKNRLNEQTCKNPWNMKYSPGGGTGGASASVACGMAPFALASDVNGSLRMSASFCGLPAICPTRGLVPTVRNYHLLYTERLFYRKGVVARTVEDIAMMLNTIALSDSRDPICCCKKHINYSKAIDEPDQKLKIAFSPDLDFLPVEDDVLKIVSQAAKNLSNLGHSIEEVKVGINSDVLTHFLRLFATDRYLLIMRAIEERGKNGDLLTDYAKDWLHVGSNITGAGYSLALAYTEYIQQKFDQLFSEFDFLVTPTMPVAPFIHGSPPSIINGKFVKPYVGLWGFLLPFNMSGHPAITIPCGVNAAGLPIGMQVVGPNFSEGCLLSFCRMIEKTYPFPKIPKIF